MAKLFMYMIRFYQRAISPMMKPHCRFIPTCSQYSYEAFSKYGFIKGFCLTLKRIFRCHPFCKGGFDPVP